MEFAAPMKAITGLRQHAPVKGAAMKPDEGQGSRPFVKSAAMKPDERLAFFAS